MLKCFYSLFSRWHMASIIFLQHMFLFKLDLQWKNFALNYFLSMKWWLKIILYEITSKLFFFYLNFQKLQYLNAVKCHLMELLILCHLQSLLRLVLIRYCIILKQCNLTTMGSIVTFSEKNTIYIVKFNRKTLLVKVKVEIVRYYKLCITALNIWSVALQ